MKKLNTHYYDGRLNIGNLLQQPCAISFEKSLDEIAKIGSHLSGKNSNRLTKVLKLLRHDRGRNYDPKNNVNVEDLLPRTWVHVKKWDNDGKLLFLEQLIDILNGPCSQGRTTRIFQIYVSCMD